MSNALTDPVLLKPNIKLFKHQEQTYNDIVSRFEEVDIDNDFDHGFFQLLFLKPAEGKTLVSIKFIIDHFLNADYPNVGKGVLIIAPKTPAPQWIDEFQQWSNIQPDSIITLFKNYKIAPVINKKKPFIMLTNYSTISAVYRNRTSSSSLFYDETRNKNLFGMIILDESHNIRNPKTQKHKSIIDLIKCNPRSIRFSLTGTPFHNSTQDLRSQALLSLPPYNTPEWQEEESLTSWISEFMVEAKDVDFGKKGIPPISHYHQDLDLTPKQKILCDHLNGMLYDKWKNGNASSITSSVMACIQYLIQIGNHPAQIDPDKTPEVDATLTEVDPEYRDMIHSSKTKFLIDKLREFKHENKQTIVFSRYLQFLDIVEYFIMSDLPEINISKLNGQMKARKRSYSIEEFKTRKTDVLLATIETAGEGLNLQNASRVIICEPQWNYSVVEQAYSRVARPGQKDDRIEVHYLANKEHLDQWVKSFANKKSQERELCLQGKISQVEKNDIKDNLAKEVFSDLEEFSEDRKEHIIQNLFVRSEFFRRFYGQNEKEATSNVIEESLDKMKKDKKEISIERIRGSNKRTAEENDRPDSESEDSDYSPIIKKSKTSDEDVELITIEITNNLETKPLLHFNSYKFLIYFCLFTCPKIVLFFK